MKRGLNIPFQDARNKLAMQIDELDKILVGVQGYEITFGGAAQLPPKGTTGGCTHVYLGACLPSMHVIEHKLRLAGDSRSWWTIKTTLRSHERITIEYISKDDAGTHFHNTVRVNSRVEPQHLEICTKLGLSGEPLERKRLTRKIGSDDTAGITPFQGVI